MMIDIGEIQKRGDREEEGCHTMLSKRTCDIIISHDEDMMIEKMTIAMVLVLGCAGTPFRGRMRFPRCQVSTARAKSKGGAAKPSI